MAFFNHQRKEDAQNEILLLLGWMISAATLSIKEKDVDNLFDTHRAVVSTFNRRLSKETKEAYWTLHNEYYQGAVEDPVRKSQFFDRMRVVHEMICSEMDKRGLLFQLEMSPSEIGVKG